MVQYKKSAASKERNMKKVQHEKKKKKLKINKLPQRYKLFSKEKSSNEKKRKKKEKSPNRY